MIFYIQDKSARKNKTEITEKEAFRYIKKYYSNFDDVFEKLKNGDQIDLQFTFLTATHKI